MTDTIHATTVSDCTDGNIGETKFWNINKELQGYWHNVHDVEKYITIHENGSLLVSYKLY